jgi:hypothetical protein
MIVAPEVQEGTRSLHGKTGTDREGGEEEEEEKEERNWRRNAKRTKKGQYGEGGGLGGREGSKRERGAARRDSRRELHGFRKRWGV